MRIKTICCCLFNSDHLYIVVSCCSFPTMALANPLPPSRPDTRVVLSSRDMMRDALRSTWSGDTPTASSPLSLFIFIYFIFNFIFLSLLSSCFITQAIPLMLFPSPRRKNIIINQYATKTTVEKMKRYECVFTSMVFISLSQSFHCCCFDCCEYAK